VSEKNAPFRFVSKILPFFLLGVREKKNKRIYQDRLGTEPATETSKK
jgi:hypothetical protein